ncbi:VOC family protein, partial [Streptomyces sp. NPDC096046]|uniref:VOC family protein n=1 Tax=Streptomyces sp. NPDC096046 TaxID=3155542 RepID=UPI00331DE1D2
MGNPAGALLALVVTLAAPRLITGLGYVDGKSGPSSRHDAENTWCFRVVSTIVGGMIGQLYAIVIDCSEPSELADFYGELLSLSRLEDSREFVVLGHESGAPLVAFQRVDDFRPPQWSVSDHPQQMHVDVMVADLDVAEPRVLALGATLLDGSDKPVGYRVYADPVGHPFCLVTPPNQCRGRQRLPVKERRPVRALGVPGASPRTGCT